jgi:hypothetical protein
MELIADMLLVAGALGSGLYCYILSARLKSFATLETGMGGAIAVLSAQVDDLTRALDQARGAATGSATALEALTARGEAVAARLELLLAAMHDLPEPGPASQAAIAARDAAEDAADRKLRVVRRRAPRAELEAAE